jgi:serine/threonine protein kinase
MPPKDRTNDKMGKWTLIEPLGAGGNADVWRGVDESGREAAIKILKNIRPDSEPYRRFQREVQVHGELSTQGFPGVLSLIDASLPDSPSRRDPAWLATAIAIPIRDALGPEPSLEEVTSAIASVADTLDRLVSQGIAHRDIKPENIYRHGDRWVVGDLGLVQVPDAEPLTVGAGVLGPRFYLAPEMMANPAGADGGPADIYSLAKTMWVLTTGQRFPPPGQHLLSERAMKVSTYTPHERAYQLDALVERATAFEPAMRPSASEFRDELAAWLRNQKRQSGVEINLAVVANDLLTLLGPIESADVNEEANWAQRHLTTHALLARMSRYLERAADSLRQAGLPVRGPAKVDPTDPSSRFMSGGSGTGVNIDLMAELLGDVYLTGDDHRHSNSIIVGAISGRTKRNPLFTSAVGIRSVRDGEPAYIFAGHAIGSTPDYSTTRITLQTGRMLWGKTANGLLRSAQLEAACDELGESMLAALPAALDQYLAELREWSQG